MTTNLTRPMITIHNAETDEVIEREMSKEEFAQYEVDCAASAERKAAAAQKAADRAALLTQLGITEAQAKLLLG
jgi:hypothetical protein